MVDKNLFLHDLSVVAILKNEGPYLKEWLDYHLLAGVDHFYLYDNDSPDNQLEVAAPYIEAGLVDYFRAPGQLMQMPIYNDAVKNFKFQSQYMAFIDGDEFIYPKSIRGGRIIDFVDEILSGNPNAAGLGINWQMFGSNGQEKADYSRGVLDRFTRRAQEINQHVKTIANPRTIDYLYLPHSAVYFNGLYAVNENGDVVPGPFNEALTGDKIIVNHYHTKSQEEYFLKMKRGRADYEVNTYNMENFKHDDYNEEFDDGILSYRDEQAKNFRLPDKSGADERLLNALMKNLAPILLPNTTEEFYAGKMETFLTCRAVSSYLRPRVVNEAQAIFFEETSLVAILRTLSSGASFADLEMFLRDLPNFLHLHYPIVGELRRVALQMISQMMDVMRTNRMWKNYAELDYLRQFLGE